MTCVPRWTGLHRDRIGVELHGFSDASTRAYAAVIYLRVFHSLSSFQVSLIAAKIKVAPLKTVSIPRLELNAVVLLNRLMYWTKRSLKLERVPMYGWTYFTIALTQAASKQWNCYVANRVSEVQTHFSSARWNHVHSSDNPASRDLSALELAAHRLWWCGPSWLSKPSALWPTQRELSSYQQRVLETILTEARKPISHHINSSLEWDLPLTYSSWTRLLRVTAYLKRFVQNLTC